MTTLTRLGWVLLVLSTLLSGCRTVSRAPTHLALPEGPLVHDRRTERTWTGLSPQAMPWDQASAYCSQMPPAGQWRLPYRPEMEALFDDGVLRLPFLPVPDAVLFTGEGVPGRESDHIWVVNPSNGHMFNGQGHAGYVRCVRVLDTGAEQVLADEARERWGRSADVVDTSGLTDAGAHVLGRPDAPITVWYFFDFCCPFCARAHTTLTQLVEQDRRVRVVYKAAPILSYHQEAEEAHAAAFAAGLQGRYWDMVERLFAQRATHRMDPDGFALEAAAELGLDTWQFEQDYRSAETAAHIQRELEQARSMGINALPTTFVAGQRISGARSLEDFQAAVDAAGK
jgi:protein-disulfide isomerase